MKERYNILWIDDQYEELGGFIDEAYGEGFDITAFSSSREGMQYLESNLSAVDAIILDAKVFKDGPEDVPSEKGLSASIRQIARISGKNQGKEIPYVVFTGQPDLESDAAFADRLDGISVFSKNQDATPLFEKLRELIGDSPDATVRNQYRDTYEACAKGKIDQKFWRLLAPVLRSVSHIEHLPNDPYNDVRKALEWIFRYLHRNRVIHERLIDAEGHVNVQSTSHFLAGNRAKVSAAGEYVQASAPLLPKLLVDALKFIIHTTHPGSHTEELEDVDAGKPSIEAVSELNPNHHLVQLVAIMTADLAVWAGNYVAANSDVDANRARWVEALTAIAGDNDHLECEGLVISEDPHGNCYVDTRTIPETGGKNIRIRKSLIDSGSRLRRGDRVSAISTNRQDKDYREAIKYRILPPRS
jgi:hypothetical protein